MDEHAKYAVLLGRLVDLLRRAPDAVDDHKAALRALTDLTGRRGATIRIDGDQITVDGEPVPSSAPFVQVLAQQLDIHGLAEVHLHHRASPVDILHLVKAFALDLPVYGPGYDVERALADAEVRTLSLLTRHADEGAGQRRGARVTEALEASGFTETPTRAAPPKQESQLGVLSSKEGAAYDEMVRHQRASSSTLAGAIQGMRKHPPGARLTEDLEGFHAAVQKAFDANEEIRALEAVVQLIREEAATDEGEVRRMFGITIRRILTSHTLQRLARRMIDEMYAEDISIVMRRAGTSGTKVLLDLLVDAPTFAERRAYLTALRKIDEGTDIVASMMNHHEWFVVRNAADLAGELGITEAVGPLSRAVTHKDARVRKSVGIALARIATPQCVQPLAKVLHDEDRGVKLAVLQQVGGRGLAALSMPLVTAAQREDDDAVLGEIYRALGRIGTPDAVQGLVNAALETGGLLSRKAAGPRVAAVEGLATAGTDAAREALRKLAKDRARDVRKAAAEALRG